jgi:uncharacterized protein
VLEWDTCHVVTNGRAAEYLEVQRSIELWARRQVDVVGVALVGSWARSQARMDSDIDLVLLTSSKDRYVVGDGWVAEAVSQPAPIIRTEEWGPLTERRVRLPSGLEVEFGFATPSWASTDPVDPGTAQVVGDGCLPMVDPEGLLARLIEAVRVPHGARTEPSDQTSARRPGQSMNATDENRRRGGSIGYD